MAWLAVDKDGSEVIFNSKPKRKGCYWENTEWGEGDDYNEVVFLTKGTINKLIGHTLTWDDKPVEI